MKVKIDTREKFHAITVDEPILAANMTAELDNCLIPMLQNVVKNVVLILKDTETVDNAAADQLAKIQQHFYESNASLVICELQLPVENQFEKYGLLEIMNITPTESEAIDVVMMEEIERELNDDI